VLRLAVDQAIDDSTGVASKPAGISCAVIGPHSTCLQPQLTVGGAREATACATEKVRECNLFETAIARTHFINTALAVIDEIRPKYGEVIWD